LELFTSLLPDGLSASAAVILIFASFFTSALTASAGVGGGLLMLALMTYLVPIQALIPVHGLVQLGSNTGRSWVQRDYIDWRITRIFLFGSLFGALAGALLVVQLPAYVLQGFLGLFILVVVWIKFPGLRHAGAGIITLGGLVTTFTSMFAGATGPLVAVFLNNIFDEHRKMVATHGATMSVQHGLKIIAFGLAGFAFWEWLIVVLLIVVSGFAGTKAGTAVLNRLPETTLQLGFRVVMTVIAIDLLRTGLV